MTPEQREELKPCPFCGGTAHIDEQPAHSHTGPLAGFMPDYPGSFTVECMGADCNTGQIADTRPDAVSMWNRRAQVEALTVPQWISVEDRLPDHGQTVAFVVDSEDWERMRYLHGRVLGGKYDASSGNFSVPGLGLIASHWKPMDAAPTIPAIPGTKEGA